MKSSPLLLTLLIACGPMATEGPVNPTTGPTTGGGGGATPAKPATAGDVSLEFEPIPVSGVVFEPYALTVAGPAMPKNEPKNKVTLAQQRSIVTNVRDPVLKQGMAMVLATMLLMETGKAPKEKRKELLEEARQALRTAAAAAGKDIDEGMLRYLGSYESLFDDWPAAEKAWAELIAREPKDPEVQYRKAWWAWSLLKQWKNAEALAVVKDEPLSDKQPELAYVTAWAKWRAGDGAGAWEAILVAAKGWDGNKESKQEVERDALLIAGRTKVPFAQAMPRLFEVLGAQQAPQRYGILTKLGTESYFYAARWADAVAALDEAIKVIDAQMPPGDLVTLRNSQAEDMVRLDSPDGAVKYAKLALEALKKCPKCSEQHTVNAVAGLARLFHNVYATANDLRYYQPANDLYTAVIPVIKDPQREAEVKGDAAKLQQTLKNMKAGTGTHSKDALRPLVARRAQEVQACYEARLVATPKIGGTLVVTLESDQTGAIKGVATEPKAGQADLAAVAGCVAEEARKWRLPTRGMAGTTRIKATFTLAPAQPAAK